MRSLGWNLWQTKKEKMRSVKGSEKSKYKLKEEIADDDGSDT